MYFSKSTIVSFGLLATSQLVAGHSAITGATGDQGGQGMAIGVDQSTPRDGTRRQPFQQDSTRFRGNAADTCGETLAGGDNDVETGTANVLAAMGGTLPQVSPGGEVSMTVHQVNSDGAGPYTCMVDASGTGTQWTQMQVTTNIEGNDRGRNRATSQSDLPLKAAMPAGMQCTGTVAGQSGVCMVRCENPARAGPFGGCVPVQMANAATGAAAGGAAAGAAAPAGAAGAAGAATPAAGAAGAAAPAAAAGNAAGAAAPAAAGAAAPANAAGAAGAATPATGATGAAGNAAGNAAGAGAAGAAAGNTGAASSTGATPALTNDGEEEEVALQRRKNIGGVTVTDDEEEEEVFKRFVVTDNKIAQGFKA